MNERKFIALTAKMDGERLIAEKLGNKRKVSEMELVVICNFANLGLLSVFSGMEGERGEEAKRMYNSSIRKIRALCGGQIFTTCAAILSGERLGRYVVSDGPDGNGSDQSDD